MLYDDKAFYVFVSDDEYHTKKMYYRSNALNGRLIISYYKKDDDIVIKINYPNKEILSRQDVDLNEYKLITKYYIERMESDGYEEYPTTYEKIYGLGIYKKFFVTGYTPDMSCIEKYLEYDYLEYDELDTIAENKKELTELEDLYNKCLDFDNPNVVKKKFLEYDKNYLTITKNFKDEEFLI